MFYLLFSLSFTGWSSKVLIILLPNKNYIQYIVGKFILWDFYEIRPNCKNSQILHHS